MNKEDFPLLVVQGVQYRMVPELPKPHQDFRCEGCAACPVGGALDRTLCRVLYRAGQAKGFATDCSFGTPGEDDPAGIYIRDSDFQDYVVELVRRRVSS